MSSRNSSGSRIDSPTARQRRSQTGCSPVSCVAVATSPEHASAISLPKTRRRTGKGHEWKEGYYWTGGVACKKFAMFCHEGTDADRTYPPGHRVDGPGHNWTRATCVQTCGGLYTLRRRIKRIHLSRLISASKTLLALEIPGRRRSQSPSPETRFRRGLYFCDGGRACPYQLKSTQ